MHVVIATVLLTFPKFRTLEKFKIKNFNSNNPETLPLLVSYLYHTNF